MLLSVFKKIRNKTPTEPTNTTAVSESLVDEEAVDPSAEPTVYLAPQTERQLADFELKSWFINDRGFLQFKVHAPKDVKLAYIESSFVFDDAIVHCESLGDPLKKGLNDIFLECNTIVDPHEPANIILAYQAARDTDE